jgi:hypothetical protein
MENNVNKFQVKGKVKVIKGSILMPENTGLRFILNVNNMVGTAESPLYPLFDKKWKKVKEEARGWYVNKTGAYKLGAVSTTPVQSDVWVVGMLCQDEKLKTDLKAVEDCLKKICASAKYEKATMHVSTLLVNAIPELQELLTQHLVNNGVSVSYYEEV